MRQTEEEAYGQVEKVRMFEWTDGRQKIQIDKHFEEEI